MKFLTNVLKIMLAIYVFIGIVEVNAETVKDLLSNDVMTKFDEQGKQLEQLIAGINALIVDPKGITESTEAGRAPAIQDASQCCSLLKARQTIESIASIVNNASAEIKKGKWRNKSDKELLKMAAADVTNKMQEL